MRFKLILSFLMSFATILAADDNPLVTTNATPDAASTNFDTIPDRHPELSTFVMLVNKAELRDVFNGTGPFTVFAPTNDAFNKLGKKKLEDLMKPENRDELSGILIYHVVPGKYLSKSLKSRESPSINGKLLNIIVDNEEIKVNNAKVIKMDIVGPNGVIHEVDTVLIP